MKIALSKIPEWPGLILVFLMIVVPFTRRLLKYHRDNPGTPVMRETDENGYYYGVHIPTVKKMAAWVNNVFYVTLIIYLVQRKFFNQ